MDDPDQTTMVGALGRRRFLLGVSAASGAIALGGLAACSSDDSSSSDGSDEARAGLTTTTAAVATDPLEEAFYAGVPLVVTMRTLQDFGGLVGINHLFATRSLSNADSKFIVAPNHDTLYAIAVLDLDAGPQVLTLPDIPDRYHVLQILDAWMGGVALLGTRATGGKAGTWVVARKGDQVDLPAGATRVDSPTRHVFILGRVRATEADVDQAAQVAASIKMTPLNPPTGAAPSLPKPIGPPQEVGRNGAEFYDELSGMLASDGPVTVDQKQALAAVDDLVGRGKTPTTDHPDQVPAMTAAVTAGLKGLSDSVASTGDTVDGWAINLDLGKSGDELGLRQQAVIARYFWGPVPAEEAVYPRAVTASDGKPLDGSKRYRIHLAGDDLPPVDGFWSFTVYGRDLYFYPNEIDRYSLSGETPGLVRSADGSVDIELSHTRPGDADVNWLPVPDGPFTLVMRLYLPQKPILEGTWSCPPIEVVSR